LQCIRNFIEFTYKLKLKLKLRASCCVKKIPEEKDVLVVFIIISRDIYERGKKCEREGESHLF